MNNIFPLWYKILTESPHRVDEIIENDGKTLNVKTLADCPVGEAWGFTAKYTTWYDDHCQECCDYSCKYGVLVYREYGTFRRLKRFSEDKMKTYISNLNKDFIKHFKDNHI